MKIKWTNAISAFWTLLAAIALYRDDTDTALVLAVIALAFALMDDS